MFYPHLKLLNANYVIVILCSKIERMKKKKKQLLITTFQILNSRSKESFRFQTLEAKKWGDKNFR